MEGNTVPNPPQAPNTEPNPQPQEQPQEGNVNAQKSQSEAVEQLQKQVEALQSQMAMMIKSGYNVAPQNAQQAPQPQGIQAANAAQFAPQVSTPYAHIKPLEELDYSI